MTLCRSNQQTLQLQQQLEQQLKDQQERQNQLDKQQKEVQKQLETMRQQNESLRKQLELEAASKPAGPVATATAAAAATRNADLKTWKAENPWYGTDYAKTQFATRYMKRLEKERPDLTGRALLDAVATKVDETFPTKH